MKKLILIFSLCCFAAGSIFAQCTNTSSFGSASINNAGTVVTISTCSFAGEYSTITGAASGQTLRFTSSVGTDFITIHSGTSNGPVLAFGVTPLTFVNTFSGTVFAHWNTNASCGTQSSCRTTTVQCVSCIPVPVDPCANIGSATCDVNQTVTLSGSGGNWSPGSCGFSTPGAEKVYTFTAPYTGVYTLNVSGGSGGYIDWFFKSTTSACGSTGWTCIDDISGSGSVTFNLTAGNYYILADAEGTSSRTQTWNISCVPPVDPCNSVVTTTCGASQTATLTGTGAWSDPFCGFSVPGSEAVYFFSAPTTGVYTLNVTGGTGGYIDYGIKSATLGCGPNGYVCIDDIITSGTVNFTLTAGDYYLVLDAESTTGATQTFTITCPQPAPANDDCANAISISCGQTVSGSTLNALPDVAPSCNGFSVGTGGAVWYTFVGNGGFLTLSTCSAGTDYDTKIHVYDGSCTALNCVTANDDDASCTTGPGVAGFKSKVTFCTTSGTTYYILVNGFLGASGNFSMSADCTPPTITIDPVGPFCQDDAAVTLTANISGGTFSGPGVSGTSFSPSAAGPGTHTITYTLCSVTATTTITVNATPANDLVENAEPMNCGDTKTGNTVCATAESLGTCGTTDGTGGGVWYVMPGTGNRITLETCNSVTDYDTKIRVFTGSPSSLTCLTGNDDDPNCTTGPGTPGFKSIVSWCSEVGTNYYILVHGFSSSEGNFMLESTCPAVGPTISCNATLAFNLDANCQFTVGDYTGLTTATDDCGATVSQSPAAGTVITGAGVTVLTFTATDGAGNTATCSGSITLTDNIAPALNCPSVVNVTAPVGQCSTAVTYEVTASDACGYSLVVSPVSGSVFGLGSTAVNAVATDVNGNSTSCTFNVNVSGDGILTLWGVPCDRTVNCSNVPAPPAIVACPTVGNSGSGSGSGHHGHHGNCNHGSGSGNHGSGHQCNYSSNGNGGSGSNGNYNGYNGHTSNPCTNGSGGSGSGHHGSGSGYHGSGSGHHGSGSGHHGSGSNSCNVYCVTNSCGVYATSVCGPCPVVTFLETIIPGSGPGCYTIVRTWTATDTYGNALSQSQTITVVDNVRPNINCPNNITVCVPMNNNTGRTVTFSATATDNCGTPTLTYSPASGSNFPIGNTYVTATANDGCGNTRTCQFRVRVERRHNCNSRMADEAEANEEKDVLPALAINAYPNPTNGMVDVEIFCEDCNSDLSYPMIVTDIYGKIVAKNNVTIVDGKAVVKLDLSGFAAGMYMINVNNLTTRVVKE